MWLSATSSRLPSAARTLLDEPENQLCFSVVSIWEIAIKRALRRDESMVDPVLMRSGLLKSGSLEISIQSSHALATTTLPLLHGDPFDRMLIAQASVEG